MTGAGPTHQDEQPPVEEAAAPTPSRAGRQTFSNMLRSLLPLVAIIVAIVAWTAFRQSPDVDPVKPADNVDSTVQLAANRAGYELLVPTGLPDDYVATSARTDAGSAEEGDPVSLEIGYVTPDQKFAGFAESDDPRADALTGVLNDATEQGTVQIDGQTWTRSTRLHQGDPETVLSLSADGVTVVVSGSASDEELQAVAGSLRPYSG